MASPESEQPAADQPAATPSVATPLDAPPSAVEIGPTQVLHQQQQLTPEHPQGDEIRRQVEYYFSDENLSFDRHLLEKCQGRLNLPVPIRSICGFPKMRRYKPYLQVVEALKKSVFLDVVEGNKIKRKLPLMGKTVLDGPDGDESDVDDASDQEKRQPEPQPKKGKEPRRPAQQPKVEKPVGFNKPHGFEEFFADAPVTPAEFQAEVGMYDPGISFRLRMECAIQRYKSRRKMHQHFLNVFAKFMRYGGVDQSQRQFTGGVNDKELEDRDAQDIALMMANHTIDTDKDDEEKWPVAFEEVAKGFLSSEWPNLVFYNMAEIRLACTVLRNFYNYLLHHDVCPEHKEDIYAARKLCSAAESEFPMVIEASANLPGDLNVACSNLFDGFYKDKFVRIGDWDDLEEPHMRGKFSEHSMEKSSIILKAAILAHGTDEQIETLEKAFDGITCTDATESIGLEVTGVEMPSSDALETYAALNAHSKGRLEVKPVGKLHCKSWDISDFTTFDLDEGYAKELLDDQKNRRYEFWVETDILQACFVGMKMQAAVRTLSLGIQVLDQVQEVFCSFYTYLANELMWKWKEPVFNADGPPETTTNGDEDDSDEQPGNSAV
ncbi:argonaute sirna chaperone complex subunit arb1 [Diplodia corticola]|uniref:Argonaute sirna chaperone complex subunit arb1 n=1 Tax=Diplodia corticola TaxID=236234 RepID=A0A1J9S942_9PEZI|nr:argonaute sirna chaperone complex subunit arb1 [Diplodia corticola]OJD36420.1 argonaute sirna chaperone complex subunit arb1 [Diplodia corticola]